MQRGSDNLDARAVPNSPSTEGNGYAPGIPPSGIVLCSRPVFHSTKYNDLVSALIILYTLNFTGKSDNKEKLMIK